MKLSRRMIVSGWVMAKVMMKSKGLIRMRVTEASG